MVKRPTTENLARPVAAVICNPVNVDTDALRVVAGAASGAVPPLASIQTGNLLARNLELPLGDTAQLARIAFMGADTVIDTAHVEFGRDDGTTDSHIFLVMAGSMTTGCDEFARTP